MVIKIAQFHICKENSWNRNDCLHFWKSHFNLANFCKLNKILVYLSDLSDLYFPPLQFRNERDWSQGFPYLVVYLSLMGGTLWNHFSPLSCHQIQKLVDKKRGGQTYDPTHGDGDQCSAYGTAKLSGVPRESGHNPVQAVKANSVWTWQQFGNMLYSIVHTCLKKKIL